MNAITAGLVDEKGNVRPDRIFHFPDELPLERDRKRTVPMKVIVCGLMRTGTSSMKAALHVLGFNDVYHMISLATDPNDAELWQTAFDSKIEGRDIGRTEWDKLLGDCQAVCDFPGSYFGVELAKAYPDAKVIVLHRDFESWYRSCDNTIFKIFRTWSPLLALVEGYRMARLVATASDSMFGPGGTGGPTKENARRFHTGYYDEIRREIPKERILEYRVQDGWEPLCAFLHVPVPTMLMDGSHGTKKDVVSRPLPFPRVNDSDMLWSLRAQYIKRSRKMFWKSYGSWVMAIIGMALGSGLAWKWSALPLTWMYLSPQSVLN